MSISHDSGMGELIFEHGDDSCEVGLTVSGLPGNRSPCYSSVRVQNGLRITIAVVVSKPLPLHWHTIVSVLITMSTAQCSPQDRLAALLGRLLVH